MATTKKKAPRRVSKTAGRPAPANLKAIDARAVSKAVAEFDRLGREKFLEKYGFRPSKRFFLVVDGRRYDSKAIIGAAAKHTDMRRALAANEFSGGAARLGGLFRRAGLTMIDADA